MNAKFTFLGTSGSTGIPVIGCKCAVCTSHFPKNQRLRPAGLVHVDGKEILIDVGPDFRHQALRASLEKPDGLILTHTHYDHIAGIDELRLFYVRTGRPFPCLLSRESLEELKIRYYYLFQGPKTSSTLSAQLHFQVLEQDQGRTEFLGIPLSYITYFQGGMKVNGFRIGDFAYISDIRDYDDSIFPPLRGVRHLVLSALRRHPSPLHLTLDEAVVFASRVGAEETYLTHISHSLEHEETNASLPKGVQLGFDGQEISFEVR